MQNEWEVKISVEHLNSLMEMRLKNSHCPFGGTNLDVAEKTCIHMHNTDPYRVWYVTFGHCEQIYCPIRSGKK